MGLAARPLGMEDEEVAQVILMHRFYVFKKAGCGRRGGGTGDGMAAVEHCNCPATSCTAGIHPSSAAEFQRPRCSPAMTHGSACIDTLMVECCLVHFFLFAGAPARPHDPRQLRAALLRLPAAARL